MFSLGSFLSDTSIARNFICLNLRKSILATKLRMSLSHTWKIAGCSLFRFDICAPKNVWVSWPYHRRKKNICIVQWSGNIITYWEKSKHSEAFGWQVWFFPYCKKVVGLRAGSTVIGKCCNLYPHLCLETIFPALKITQNCFLRYIIL